MIDLNINICHNFFSKNINCTLNYMPKSILDFYNFLFNHVFTFVIYSIAKKSQ